MDPAPPKIPEHSAPTLGGSADITELAAALAKAQSDIPAISMNQENPYYHSKYADLASIIGALRPVLAKHGLAVMQQILPADRGKILVRSILIHTSGQWIPSDCELPVGVKDDGTPKTGPQPYGSAISYARRYGLSALICIAADADDDGNGAQGEPKQRQPQRQAAKSPAARKPAKQRSQPKVDPNASAKFKDIQDCLRAFRAIGLDQDAVEAEVSLRTAQWKQSTLAALRARYELIRDDRNAKAAAENENQAVDGNGRRIGVVEPATH